MRQLKGVLLCNDFIIHVWIDPLVCSSGHEGGRGVGFRVFYRFAISAVVVGVYLLLRRTDLRDYFKGVWNNVSVRRSVCFYLAFPNSILPVHSQRSGHDDSFPLPGVGYCHMIVFFKDKISLSVIIATVLAIGGVYLLSSGEGQGRISLKGLFMVLSTVVTYAIYIVGVNKSCIRHMEGLKMTFYMLFCCTIIFGVNILVKGQGLDMMPSANAVVHIFLLSLIPTLVSDLTLILAIQHVGSTTAAILGCMEPLTAVSMGVLFLEERFGIGQILGVVIVLVAVFIVILSSQPGHFSMKRLIPSFIKIRR